AAGGVTSLATEGGRQIVAAVRYEWDVGAFLPLGK
ncbi:MAG: hypothetical protein ACI9SE_003944, partial [Neolewinella sp.]